MCEYKQHPKMKSSSLFLERLPLYNRLLNFARNKENLNPSPFQRGCVTSDNLKRKNVTVPSRQEAEKGTTSTLFRSFRRKSLRRSFRRTKSLVAKDVDSFVNSQEWTLARNVPDLRLGIVGALSSGKSALVHRYLTGTYMQEESPEGGRFKKEVSIDGQSHLLLIRDEGGQPELQFTTWVDAVIFVFSLDCEVSFSTVYNYYLRMSQFRNIAEIPVILVATQDTISEGNPRVVDQIRVSKLAQELKARATFETCATYGSNVEKVFQEACQKILQSRIMSTSMPPPTILPPAPRTPSNRLTQQYHFSNTNGGQYYNSVDRLPPGHIISPAVAERLSGQLPATPTMSERLATSSHSPYLNQSVLRKPDHRLYNESLVTPSTQTVTARHRMTDDTILRRANITTINYTPSTPTLTPCQAGNLTTTQSGSQMSLSVPGDRSSVDSISNRGTPPSSGDLLSVSGKDGGKDLPTPSSTPTTSRKSRRRSNLFIPSSKKEESRDKSNKNIGSNSEFGSGRSIPVKQGALYKRGTGLNKDWKKKYVTLSDDGKLTYHPSINEYMEDVQGKVISLQFVTVKVPGQKPRGSRSTMNPPSTPVNPSQSNGNINALDSVGSLSIVGGYNIPLIGKDKKDKVLLTAYELLKEGGANKVVNGSEDLSTEESCRLETPNVKKRHRRMKSSGNKANDLEEYDGFEFQIVSLDNKTWHFEASSLEERDEWVTAIEGQILNLLQGNESSKSKGRVNPIVDPAQIQSIKNVPGNLNCADCDAPSPDWASLNLGILVCIECSGIHRKLGSHISRVRSLDLDEWTPTTLSVLLSLGNEEANSIWEAKIDKKYVKPNANSFTDERERWIRTKYERREFTLPPPSSPPLGQRLVDAVCRSDIKSVYSTLIHATSDDVNCLVAKADGRRPLHLAAGLGNPALVQILLWHNADPLLLDHEGRSALSFARASNSPDVIDLLISNKCPEGNPVHASGTLARRKGSVTRKPDCLDKLPASVI
ncbi:centaurin-gamma-1A-like isoform X1 [Artemia franciscana]